MNHFCFLFSYDRVKKTMKEKEKEAKQVVKTKRVTGGLKDKLFGGSPGTKWL